MQKDHSVSENIQTSIQLINFNILLGLSLNSICPTNDIRKINNNTNIHLDPRQIGLRPHTITANIVVGLDEYLLNIIFIELCLLLYQRRQRLASGLRYEFMIDLFIMIS